MNKMDKVAELLGVEIGEEFEIDVDDSNKYKLGKDGLACFINGKWVYHDILQYILLGIYKIIKLPKKPLIGSDYYLSVLTTPDNFILTKWTDSKLDNMYFERGLVFLTEIEAIEHTDELLEYSKRLRNSVGL